MVDDEFYPDVLGGEDDDPDNMISFFNAAEAEEGVLGMDDHELLPPLIPIFDHPMIEKCQVVNDKEETWERKKLSPRGDPILEARLTAKYQGLKLYDIDNGNTVLTIHRMALRKERGNNKYDVFAILPGFNHEHPDDSEVNDDYWQPWEVNEDLFDCMRAYYNDVQDNKIKTYDLGEGCESDTE